MKQRQEIGATLELSVRIEQPEHWLPGLFVLSGVEAGCNQGQPILSGQLLKAETIDEAGTSASTWITKELWGVGSAGPYLHDGRATTLTEAILEHGGEAEDSRQDFEALSTSRQEESRSSTTSCCSRSRRSSPLIGGSTSPAPPPAGPVEER